MCKIGSNEEIRVAQNELFSKFTFSPELLNLIKDAPPLYGVFGKYELNVNIDVVLKKKIGAIITESPLLFIEEIETEKWPSLLLRGGGSGSCMIIQ